MICVNYWGGLGKMRLNVMLIYKHRRIVQFSNYLKNDGRDVPKECISSS